MAEKEAIKMKTQIFLSTLLLIGIIGCQRLYSQENKIEYVFPGKVNRAINSRLSLYKEPEYKFYIIIGNVFFSKDCGNYQLSIGAYRDTPNEVIKKFIDQNNRYYKYEELMVPVIFEYDFSFASFGRDSKGRVIKKDITSNSNSYVIEFNVSGEIVR